MALSKTTQDHEEIKAWAEKRGAIPSEVESTERQGEPGILRFQFPNAKNANDGALKGIEWEDFFEKFDRSGLALVYQDVTAEGAESNFNKLVHPENVSASSKKSPSKKTASKTSAKTSKAPVKKAPAKSSKAEEKGRPAVKKSPAKKSAAKKAPAKASAKKAPAKKTPAKKAAAPKTVAKKTPAKKAPAKKQASKGPARKR